jgi:hypothetical protein
MRNPAFRVMAFQVPFAVALLMGFAATYQKDFVVGATMISLGVLSGIIAMNVWREMGTMIPMPAVAIPPKPAAESMVVEAVEYSDRNFWDRSAISGRFGSNGIEVIFENHVK